MNKSQSKNPSVHLVSATTSGGAGRAAVRLRQALETHGTQTTFSVQRHPASSTTKMGGYPLLGNPWWISPAVSRAVTKLNGSRRGIRSLNWLPTGRLSQLNSSPADVINLHWLGSDTLSISEIGGLRKPFVWTLHDMWAFCGTEHLAPFDESARWRTGYADSADWPDLDRWVWQQKRKHFPSKGFAVCPSHWLSSCVQESALMNQWHVRTIPNPIDTDTYAPRNKKAARQSLGLAPNEWVILFGAQGVDSDPNKGFELIQDMMGYLASLPTEQTVRCLIFGNERPGPDSFNGLPATYLGRLNTDESLVAAYSAADIVVVPSRQENLPQVATEAQSCGRPVVAFATSGLKDAIQANETGLLIPPYDTEAGAQQLKQLLANEPRRKHMENAARTRAVDLWNPGVVAQQYEDCFRHAVSEHERLKQR